MAQVKASARLPREVRLCTWIAFVVALGFGVIAPALPILAEQFGAGSTLVGLAISAMAFMRFATAVVNSRLVARFGEQQVLAVGLWVQSVTTVAAGLAPDFEWLVLLRALGGIGSSAFTVAAMSLVLRTAPRGRAGESLSVFQSGFMLGAIVGPGVGGFLADLDARLPFLLYGVLLALAGLIAHLRLPATPPRPVLPPGAAADGHAPEPEDRATLGRPRSLTPRAHLVAFAAALTVNFGTGWLFYGVRNSTIPMYATHELQASGTYVGVALLLTAVAQVVAVRVFGRWTDSRGRKAPMVTATTLGTGAVVLLASVPGDTAFLVSMLLLGVAGGGFAAAAMAVLSDLSQHHRARNVAWFNMSADLGAIIGPIAAGLIADATTFGMAFGVTAGVLAIGLVTSLVMPETLAVRPRGTSRRAARVRTPAAD